LKRKISAILIYFQFSFMEIKYRSEYSTLFSLSQLYVFIAQIGNMHIFNNYLESSSSSLKNDFFLNFFLVIMIFKTFTQMFKILTFFFRKIFFDCMASCALAIHRDVKFFFVYFVFYVLLVSCISIDNFKFFLFIIMQ